MAAMTGESSRASRNSFFIIFSLPIKSRSSSVVCKQPQEAVPRVCAELTFAEPLDTAKRYLAEGRSPNKIAIQLSRLQAAAEAVPRFCSAHCYIISYFFPCLQVAMMSTPVPQTSGRRISPM